MPFLIPFVAAALVEIGVGAATATILAGIIVSVGLSLVASLIQSALMPKPADGKIPKRQPIPPRIRAFGRARLSGSYMLYEASTDGHSVDVLALHDGLIDGYERYFLHDDEVTLDGSGFVNTLANGSYGPTSIRIVTRLGLATETAYAEAIGYLPTIWTSAHRGDGIASLEMICRSVGQTAFQKVYPQQLPQPSVVARWRKCFDPRVSGQDASDPSTWTFTANPICAILTFLIDDMGEDYDTRILPEISYWITAANVCDESVALNSSGSEARYELGGFYQMDNDPSDILSTMLGTCDGWLGETGSGALRIFAGKFYEPTITIEGKHIIGFKVQKFIEDESAINEIIFSYVDPAQKYTEVEGDPVRDEADITARGKVRSQNVTLSWVQSHSRARRLVTREMYRLTSDARGTIKTDLYGFLALGERYVNISIPELPSLCTFPAQISNAQIDITDRSVTFDWIKICAEIDDWNPATQEGTPPTGGSPAPDEVLPTPTGVSVVTDTAHLYVTFDTPTREDLNWAIRYRTSASGSASAGDWQDQVFINSNGSGPPPTTTVTSAFVHPDTSYDVEVAFVGPGGTYSDYTSPVTVSTAPETGGTNFLRIIGGTPGRAPATGEEFFNALMAAGDEFLDGSGGSFAKAFLECESAPSADWTMTLKVNGVTVATGTILAGATVGSFSGLAGPLTFADADNFTAMGPTPAIGGIIGVAYGFFGTKVV